MKSLVDDLLTLARADSGKLELASSRSTSPGSPRKASRS